MLGRVILDSGGENSLEQGSADFSFKGTGSKYFRLCRPDGLHCNDPPHHSSTNGQFINKWAWR